MTWILVVVYGISWAGPGGRDFAEYPNEQSCYRALQAIKFGDQPIAESDKKRNAFAYCKPKETK